MGLTIRKFFKNTFSRRENSEIVMTAAARFTAARLSHRRRMPSRTPNHSGCATNDTSWIATTRGTLRRSGMLYAGENHTST